MPNYFTKKLIVTRKKYGQEFGVSLNLAALCGRIGRIVATAGSAELIAVPGSKPAGDVSHKLDGRLPLLSARSAVTLATLNRAATS